MNLQLFGRDSSYNVQKVLWLASEMRISLDRIQCGGKYGTLNSPEFIAMNPMQKVPVLCDQGHCIWESNSILRYLADKYGEGDWCVVDPFRRSEYERWMDWAQCTFEPAFTGVFWGYYRTPEPRRDLHAIAASVLDCEAYLQKLDQQLGTNDYLLGEQLTLADICAGVFLYRLAEIDMVVAFPERVLAWYKRLKKRASYQQEVMRDFSELAGRLAY